MAGKQVQSRLPHSVAVQPADALLDAHLDERERELLHNCERLARERFAPLAVHGDTVSPVSNDDGAADDSQSQLNRPLVRALADEGLLERLFREGPDGHWTTDIAAIDLCLIREGLARACTAAETAFALQGLGSFPLLQSGTPAAIERWVPRLATGEAVAAFALSEPQAGSDVAALSLRAEPDGDCFRLSGEKTWISNAPEADIYSVFARTTEGAGARGLTGFLVERDSSGLSGEPLTLLSPHPIGRLLFEGVLVPPEHVLGEVDRGFAVAMRTLDLFRPSVGAFAIGMAHCAMAAAIDYVSRREAFGTRLKDQQALAHRLADVATCVQAARLLVYHAARAYDAGLRPVTQVAAMAKLMATEVAQEAVDFAVQVHGARALQRGNLLEHLYREVRAPRIYEGASEIQREIIARTLFATTVVDRP